MADTYSRIILEAQGGDKAAREIKKISDAYQGVSKAQADVGRAAQVGAPTDPFTRAVSDVPDDISLREQRKVAEDNRVAGRQAGHEQTTQAGFSAGRAAQGILPQGAAIAGQAQQGRIGAAAGGALGMGGMLLAGTGVGIGLMAAAAMFKGVDALAQKEEDRVRLLYPLSRQADVGYEYMREEMIRQSRSRAAVSPQEYGMFMSSYLKTAGIGPETSAAAESMSVARWTGMDFGTAARFLGVMRRQGYTGEITPGMIASGEQTYGRGRLTEFFGKLSGTVEEAQSRGISKGWDDVATNLARYRAGGLTADAASRMYQTIENTMTGATAMTRPEDAIIYRALRGEGMSYNQIMKTMATGQLADPLQDPTRKIYDYLKTLAVGDAEYLERLVQSTFNLSWGQVDEFISALETTVDPTKTKKIAPVKPDAGTGIDTLQRTNRQWLPKISETSNEILNLLGRTLGPRETRMWQSELYSSAAQQRTLTRAGGYFGNFMGFYMRAGRKFYEDMPPEEQALFSEMENLVKANPEILSGKLAMALFNETKKQNELNTEGNVELYEQIEILLAIKELLADIKAGEVPVVTDEPTIKAFGTGRRGTGSIFGGGD